ncbi:MAG: hypothetical protein HRU41_06700 [Saprospiraceae bacterium]|nr:hypothetical protein [Saprospiraceae bacterium]
MKKIFLPQNIVRVGKHKPYPLTNLLAFLLVFLLGLSDLQAQSKAPSGKALLGGLRARQIGPAAMSGRVSSVAVVPGQAEIIYVGAAGGGVWKSVTGGTTFRPVFDDHSQSIGKVAIDPSEPETVWVGTGEPWVRNSVSVGTGLYKTTNGGTDWQLMGLENSERISDIIVHPTNSDIVYVAALGHLWDAHEERGVFKTTDGGKTWTKVLYIDENTGCADIDIDPENPDILYAAMWSHRRRPWTFDSGFNGKSGLYKTTDGGSNWETIHEGLPTGKLGRLGIGVAPSNGKVIYLSVESEKQEEKGLYRSTDQGANWEQVSTDFNTTVRPFYFSNVVVDPQNDSIVAKCGLAAILSEDQGNRFRTMGGGVHSDIHDIWFDPANSKHILLATDGGVYESFDRGQTFRMWMNLPISQFYHVSVDNDFPYNVYGGLQDNGSWYAPSRKSGGINNSDWKSSFGGDGFYSFRHPTQKDIIFSEYQGGNLARYNSKTGQAKEIKPYPTGDEEKFRFNWNAPVHLSPTNPNRMYFGAQYLFVSNDMGDSWKRISPDLTTDDPEKQKQHLSGGLSIDNSTAENHCTIYTIAESPKNDQVIWAGTDDGLLQLTTNAGGSWTNVTANVPGLPANTWVTFIEPSPHDANAAYVTFDGHRNGDGKTYLYYTADQGKTWKSVGENGPEGYALSVRQDLVNPNLVFLGTEFGLYVSLDGGENWDRFENNLPKVGVRDMVIHSTANALVMGTHGRGIIIIDDISPLRAISEELLQEKIHFFASAPTVLRDPGAGGGWFGGSGNFVGPNPTTNAQIVYYMNRRHTFGKMYLEVWKDGELLRTLPAGKSAGINFVSMPTAIDKPKAAPSKNRMALIGAISGPNLEAGKYDVKLIKGKNTYETSFELAYDEESPYSPADRKLQHEKTMTLYGMVEKLAYLYHSLDQVQGQLAKQEDLKRKVQAKVDELEEAVQATKYKISSQEGDYYVNESEQLHERISDLYRQVSSFPGKPSSSQLQRLDLLQGELKTLNAEADALLQEQLVEVNKWLAKADRDAITFSSVEEFMKGEGGSSQGSYQQLRVEKKELLRGWMHTPLGSTYFLHSFMK